MLVFLSAFLVTELGHAQTNFLGFTLVDNPPITGSADELTGPMLLAGEVNAAGFPPVGLARARLIVQLPPLPANSPLSHATLGLYLLSNTGNSGNATFGPLSLYHNFKPNSVALSTEDYADTNYVLVTNSVVTPDSPAGQYYEADVTAQVAKDYAADGAAPVSDFRFEVDGLQYTGGTHYYQFYFAGVPYTVHPVYLNITVSAPNFPVLSFGFQNTLSKLALSWPTNYDSYILKSADSPNAQSWTTVTNQPVVANGQFRVTIDANLTRQFFRLQQ